MNEVHCPPSETDVEKAVHTPCTHRHSPDDKTIPTRPGGARRLWRKTGRPKRSGRTDDRLSLRPSLSPQLRAARRMSSAFRAIAIKLRSAERRVGKECVSTCRYRWLPEHSKKNHITLSEYQPQNQQQNTK